LLELIAVVAMLAERERIGTDLRNGIIPFMSGGAANPAKHAKRKCPDHTLGNA